MAQTHSPTRQRRSQLRASKRGTPSMSERQLDAYLLTRDTLRGLRTVASMTPDMRRDASPPASPA